VDSETCGSIGRPIENTRMYVLDEHFEPLPIGVIGELYIGGVGLARGYQNLPEHTAERFVPDPFSSEEAGRLYRTGDRCRWRQNGVLEFVGRIGDQIKLRGFRIELREIEEVIKEHTSVAQCVALLREDEPGRKQIVAYYIPESGMQLSTAALRSHLRERLPDYMIPSAFVTLDALPLTPSGKLDRRKLLAPDNTNSLLEGDYVAPRDSIELRLAALWCEHLGLKQIGVHDDFFAMGGHSLMAIGLFASIEKEFGKRIPLALLFEKRTIAQLSIHIAASTPAGREIATLITLQPHGTGPTLFMMPSIGGELLFAKTLIEELGNGSPVIGIQPAMIPENIESFRDFRETARHFVDVILKHQPHGPFALTGYSWGGIMAFEIACILTELGEKVDLLAVIDVGPQSAKKPKFWNRLSYLAHVLHNLPLWVRDEILDFSAMNLINSGMRNLRRIRRQVASFGRARIELDDVLDASRIPSQNRELMNVMFAAFRDYIPRTYAGKLTLLRAKTRPLLSGRPSDLGWQALVDDIVIHQLNGNHLTILHRPNVTVLSKRLSQLLAGLRNYAFRPELSKPDDIPLDDKPLDDKP
jgi:thioesterase domain-containing protein/acyl carrier protein